MLDPPVSVPMPMGAKPAVMETAGPEDEPPHQGWSLSRGSSHLYADKVCPPYALHPRGVLPDLDVWKISIRSTDGQAEDYELT